MTSDEIGAISVVCWFVLSAFLTSRMIEDWPSAPRQRRWLDVGILSLTIGVGVLGEVGVSGYAASSSARHISKAQHDELKTALSTFKGTDQYTVYAQDTEASQYATEISQAFSDANWNYDGGNYLFSTPPTALGVYGNKSTAAKSVVMRAFQRARIHLADLGDEPDVPLGAIRIYVGPKSANP